MTAETRMRPEDMAALLRQGIRENVLVPGQQLVQDDLAKRFGVSRNPVREALRMLAAEGLVTLAAGEGAVVRVVSADDLDELYSLRLAVEPLLAPHIIRRARTMDVAALRALAEALDAPQEMTSWLRDNYRFHVALYALADQPHTERVLTNLLTLIQPYSYINVEHLDGRDKANKDHLAMVSAIEAGDAQALAELFRSHLGEARERLLSEASGAAGGEGLDLLRGLGR
ncbi:MAG: transcriptional regulator [Frankiales bacterium]|jgi:DNA-binding GntR family transcriptional regulator|nr:transcriptional regulator [Frankiales bacterium]